jgi:hypothetical protein
MRAVGFTLMFYVQVVLLSLLRFNVKVSGEVFEINLLFSLERHFVLFSYAVLMSSALYATKKVFQDYDVFRKFFVVTFVLLGFSNIIMLAVYVYCAHENLTATILLFCSLFILMIGFVFALWRWFLERKRYSEQL